MMQNTLPPWATSPASMDRKPVQPVEEASAWPWVSCPSMNVTWTSLQLIDESSGSVTVTLYWILSPKENRPPSSGAPTLTVGLVLPTVMIVDRTDFWPDESVTVRMAVYRPALV